MAQDPNPIGVVIPKLKLTQIERDYAYKVSADIIGPSAKAILNLPKEIRPLAFLAGMADALEELKRIHLEDPEDAKDN